MPQKRRKSATRRQKYKAKIEINFHSINSQPEIEEDETKCTDQSSSLSRETMTTIITYEVLMAERCYCRAMQAQNGLISGRTHLRYKGKTRDYVKTKYGYAVKRLINFYHFLMRSKPFLSPLIIFTFRVYLCEVYCSWLCSVNRHRDCVDHLYLAILILEHLHKQESKPSVVTYMDALSELRYICLRRESREGSKGVSLGVQILTEETEFLKSFGLTYKSLESSSLDKPAEPITLRIGQGKAWKVTEDGVLHVLSETLEIADRIIDHNMYREGSTADSQTDVIMTHDGHTELDSNSNSKSKGNSKSNGDGKNNGDSEVDGNTGEGRSSRETLDDMIEDKFSAALTKLSEQVESSARKADTEDVTYLQNANNALRMIDMTRMCASVLRCLRESTEWLREHSNILRVILTQRHAFTDPSVSQSFIDTILGERLECERCLHLISAALLIFGDGVSTSRREDGMNSSSHLVGLKYLLMNVRSMYLSLILLSDRDVTKAFALTRLTCQRTTDLSTLKDLFAPPLNSTKTAGVDYTKTAIDPFTKTGATNKLEDLLSFTLQEAANFEQKLFTPFSLRLRSVTLELLLAKEQHQQMAAENVDIQPYSLTHVCDPHVAIENGKPFFESTESCRMFGSVVPPLQRRPSYLSVNSGDEEEASSSKENSTMFTTFKKLIWR